MNVSFAKMSGAGNTFVLIDNRDGVVEKAIADAGTTLDAFVIRACSPVHGAATDGLILIERADGHDFAWRFFNRDGSHANMCGNGARCAARFARLEGITEDRAAFVTGAGVVHSQVVGERVRVSLTPPGPVTTGIQLTLGRRKVLAHQVDTGVPHLVIPVDDLNAVDVQALGAEARFHKRFQPGGTNVNFVSEMGDGTLRVRTYERGVEGETLACGTGVTAAALVYAHLGHVDSPVPVVPLSGERLAVYFTRRDGGFADVVIEGPAKLLFRGEFGPEALS